MCAMSVSEMKGAIAKPCKDKLDAVVNCTQELVLGKEHQIRLALACLLARGHLLIEDIPGVGKTLLAQALARGLGLDYQRIQFTSDLLPADILGISVYDRETGSFQFHPGPIFAQLILADEVNRATPKAQSALLEAMEEHQVTQEGETRKLPEPFFVIATQNPSNQVGTFPLPESQLDRFLMRLALGYPDATAERALLRGRDRREMVREMPPSLGPDDLAVIQRRVPEQQVSDALLDYLQDVVAFTRESPEFRNGLSPRASLAALHSAQAWALMEGRDYVIPEDLQVVLPPVVAHRLRPAQDEGDWSALAAAEKLLGQVPIP